MFFFDAMRRDPQRPRIAGLRRATNGGYELVEETDRPVAWAASQGTTTVWAALGVLLPH
jgi:hypothetical protein